MPTMINLGSDISCQREQKPSSLGLCRVQPKSDDSQMLRINHKDNKKLEYCLSANVGCVRQDLKASFQSCSHLHDMSTNKGLSWHPRYAGNSGVGTFSDLMEAGKEILGTTDKGLFYSTNKGLSWNVRRRN